MKDEYLCGLFDAEGCVGLSLSEKTDLKCGIGIYPHLTIGINNAYFSGLFDGDGCAFLSLREEKRWGPCIQPVLSLRIKLKSGEELLAKIKEKYGGYVCKSGSLVYWQMAALRDVERVTNILLKNCIIKRPQLLIFREVVIPMLKKGEHLTKEGLLKLIEIQKALNPVGKNRRDWKVVLKNYHPRQIPYKRWTREEEQFIKKNYKNMIDKQIAMKLGRSEASVREHRGKALGLKKG